MQSVSERNKARAERGADRERKRERDTLLDRRGVHSERERNKAREQRGAE